MRLSTSTTLRLREPFGYEQPVDWTRGGWHRRFCCYFWFVGWDCVQLGFHVALALPNVEIHVPFGFFRIGWLMRRS